MAEKTLDCIQLIPITADELCKEYGTFRLPASHVDHFAVFALGVAFAERHHGITHPEVNDSNQRTTQP